MTHPDLARLRALAEAAKQDCRIGEESCPACCAKRELTGDVVRALLAEVEAGRALRERFTTDPDCGCADCCGDRLATLAYDAARAGGA